MELSNSSCKMVHVCVCSAFLSVHTRSVGWNTYIPNPAVCNINIPPPPSLSASLSPHSMTVFLLHIHSMPLFLSFTAICNPAVCNRLTSLSSHTVPVFLMRSIPLLLSLTACWMDGIATRNPAVCNICTSRLTP